MENTNAAIRTDLALETAAKGARISEERLCGLRISRLTGEGGEKYVTLHCPPMRCLEGDVSDAIADAVAYLLREFCRELTGREVDGETRVLVAGLGNRFITSDALGPRTADKVAVTGHMMGNDGLLNALGCSSISAVRPGVMGQTGIEAAAVIKGAAEHIRPHVIIAVDALAARGVNRLAATVQISDSGIRPGSGIGNCRGAVNRETMGFPVIALGVPTIVDSATLVLDALEAAGMASPPEELWRVISDGSFFVSLKDCDIVTDEISSLLADGINRAFNAEGLR